MSIILAKILGIYLLAIGIAIFFGPERFKRLFREMLFNESLLFYGGLLAILIGAFIVSVHNVWALGWPLLITILGWWSLIKGFAILVYPELSKHFSFIADKSKEFYLVLGAVYAIIGLFLSYHGWF